MTVLAKALGEGFDRMVRSGLRGIWVRGDLPAGPAIWAANHHSWWDPFVAAAVLRRRGQTACLLISQDNIGQYGFVRGLGVFGARQPRTGQRYLEQGRVLTIYPEGELRPAGRPGPRAPGASWYAARAGVPLTAVAVRLAMRGHQAPEAFVSLMPVVMQPTPDATTAELARVLARELSTLDEALAAADPRAPLPGFAALVMGRRSWDERIDSVTRWRPWRS
jgi:1-acyl-sn-glycerol-3-phosphate acyltransferase